MQKIIHPNGVVYFKSDRIKVKHAFATRLGGVSTLEHTRSLNLAFGRGDGDQTVLENLRLFGEAVGFESESVVSMPQIHSKKVITVSFDMCGEGYFKAPSVSCDGYVTSDKNVTVGVKTADCTPILLSDEKNGIVAALHAGWRGTFSDICGEGVCKMLECGADITHIVAVIGPSICQNCYEVGQDVMDAALACMGDDAYLFFEKKADGSKYLADVKGANRYLLIRAGILPGNIEVSELCTYERPDLFWSHRYTKGNRGTMLSVIMNK